MPVILMSAAPPEGVTSRPDLAFLEKPFEMDTLLTLIRQILLRELMQAFLFSSN